MKAEVDPKWNFDPILTRGLSMSPKKGKNHQKKNFKIACRKKRHKTKIFRDPKVAFGGHVFRKIR